MHVDMRRRAGATTATTWMLDHAPSHDAARLLLPRVAGDAAEIVPIAVSQLARASFGVWGANIPALIRAVIAICWYGIQTYLASTAVLVLLLRIYPGLQPWQDQSVLGLSLLGWACFILLWVLQLLVILRGMEAVRRSAQTGAPVRVADILVEIGLTPSVA